MTFPSWSEIIKAMLAPFVGSGAGLPKVAYRDDKGRAHAYGEYGDTRFENRGEQVVFFATSGSTGYMQNGKYVDIGGAAITEAEFQEILKQARMEKYLEHGAVDKDWHGEMP